MMKTEEQLSRYIYLCDFPEEDWIKVVKYCEEHYPGISVYKGRRPKYHATFEDFLYWETGEFGQGDIVRYGHICAVIGECYARTYTFAIYQSYDKRIIAKTMVVMDPERMKCPTEVEEYEFRDGLIKKNACYHVKVGMVGEIYRPQPYHYVTIKKSPFEKGNVGFYIGSEGDEHKFAALCNGKHLHMNCTIQCNIAYLEPALQKDIRKFHERACRDGWSYNERTHTFVKTPKRGRNNVYWYLSDRFEIICDKDNGSAKHTDRFKAGNYFTDNATALLFMRAVKKLREEGI